MSWPEVTSLYAQGQAAMISMPTCSGSIMEDPKQATDVVRNNTGYAPLPAGPAGLHPVVLVCAGLSVNYASEHAGAAWYFIEWALSKANQEKAILAGVPAARTSAWQNEEFMKTAPADWIDASQKSFAVGNPNWNPPVRASARSARCVRSGDRGGARGQACRPRSGSGGEVDRTDPGEPVA